MAITLVGNNGSNTTSIITMPTHAIGDLILICGSRNSATPPTVNTTTAGFTSLGTVANASFSSALAYRIATSTSDASGTWTNASQMIVAIYRPTVGNSIAVGNVASNSATGSITVTFPPLTLVGAANSWVAGFAASNTATSITGAVTGMTERSDTTLGTGRAASYDTNAAVTSWASHMLSVASGQNACWSVEVMDVAPPPPVLIARVVHVSRLAQNNRTHPGYNSLINSAEIQLIGQDTFFSGPGCGPDYDWPNPQRPRQRNEYGIVVSTNISLYAPVVSNLLRRRVSVQTFPRKWFLADFILSSSINLVGAVSPTVNITGVQANSAAGVLFANIQALIAGVQGSTAAGALFANIQVTANGVQANSTAGILFANIQVTANGVQANSAAGILFANVQVTANGAQANSTAGTLFANVQITTNGAQANAQAGTTTEVSGQSANAVGVQANSTAGILFANVQVTANGAQANSTAGILFANVQITANGVQVNSAAGITTANVQALLASARANSAAGILFANVQITANGAQANSAAGATVGNVQAISNGAQANSAAGVLFANVQVTANGVHVTSAAGTLALSLSGFGTGTQSNAQAGTLLLTDTNTITGVQANSKVGAVTVTVSPTTTGVQANTATGIVNASIAFTVSGAQGNSGVGQVSFNGTLNIGIVGVQANSGAGILTDSITIVETGARANSAAGIVVPTIFPTITGVHATSAAGLLTDIIAITALGARANSAAGILIPSIAPNISGVQAVSGPGIITVTISPTLNGVIASCHAGIESSSLFGINAGVQANTGVGILSVSISASEIISGVQANTGVSTFSSFTPIGTLVGVMATTAVGLLQSIITHPIHIATPTITIKLVAAPPRTIRFFPNNHQIAIQLNANNTSIIKSNLGKLINTTVQLDGNTSMKVALNIVPTGNN